MTTLAFGIPNLPELLVIGGIALLLFGRRLPEVMRSMGKGVVEFKRGLKDIEKEVDAPEENEKKSSVPPPPPPPPPADKVEKP